MRVNAFFFSSRRRHTISVSAFLLNRSSDLRSLIMFQTFISRHNSNFFSDKLVLTSVTPASSAPVLQTPKATSSTLYFDSLTVNAGNGGFLHCIQMDTSVNAANQVVSVGADIARSEERFSRNAETDIVCRLLLEKKNGSVWHIHS